MVVCLLPKGDLSFYPSIYHSPVAWLMNSQSQAKHNCPHSEALANFYSRLNHSSFTLESWDIQRSVAREWIGLRGRVSDRLPKVCCVGDKTVKGVLRSPGRRELEVKSFHSSSPAVTGQCCFQSSSKFQLHSPTPCCQADLHDHQSMCFPELPVGTHPCLHLSLPSPKQMPVYFIRTALRINRHILPLASLKGWTLTNLSAVLCPQHEWIMTLVFSQLAEDLLPDFRPNKDFMAFGTSGILMRAGISFLISMTVGATKAVEVEDTSVFGTKTFHKNALCLFDEAL